MDSSGSGGGGGGDSSKSAAPAAPEERLNRLEMEMIHLKSGLEKLDGGVSALRKSVEDLRVDYARFDERSKQFPTKGFIFTTAAGMLGAMGALTALIVRFMPLAS